MRAAIFAYTRRGIETARRIRDFYPEDCPLYVPARFAEGTGVLSPIPADTAGFYAAQFQDRDALIFVGATGIAVRAIAPHVRSKVTDPAVLSVDESAAFVIPLLSGHIGGANVLARELAEYLGAVPVVTTATDVNRRFSVDAWAAGNGFLIDDLKAAKRVSAAILERDVPLCSDFPISGDLPPGVVAGESGPLGIYIGWKSRGPFTVTLRLIPRALRLGLGCRRNIPAAAVAAAVDAVLAENEIDPRAVSAAASIDLKADEAGLLEFCRERSWPLRFYSAERLREVPGDFTASPFVEKTTGVDNVCERAALAEGERLIVKKTALNGVTVAVAAEKVEVCFDEAVCGGHRSRERGKHDPAGGPGAAGE